MSEQTLNTISELHDKGNIFELFTQYVSDFFIKGLIAIQDLIENKVDVRQGQLGFSTSYSDITFSLNSEGELIIESNLNKDFYIDENGLLVMEETI